MAVNLNASKVLDYQSNEINNLSPIDIAIVTTDAEKTLIQILPIMKQNSSIYLQTRIGYSNILQYIVTPEISIHGAFAYELNDFNEVMNLISVNKINTNIITDRIKMQNINNISDLINNKDRSIKTIIDMDF